MDKNKLIESATKLISKNQFEKAAKEYQRALEEDPDDVRVLQKLAELYQKMQKKEESADCFEKVARTYAAQGFYLKAVALYKQVLKVTERISVNVRLAELYQQLSLIGDATKEWQNIAAHYEKVGDQKASLDTLRKLVDLDPDNFAARIRLGEQYARQDQVAEAVAELRRAATYLQRNGRQDDFLRVAERISHLDPADAALARDLADAYLARNDSKRALAKLQICFKANPRDLGTLQMLARAFQDLGQVSKTVSVLKELAHVHSDAGRNAEARRAYEQARELAPEDGELISALQSLESTQGSAPTPARATAQAPAPAPKPVPTPAAAAPAATPPPAAARPASPPPAARAPAAASGPVALAQIPKLLKETEVYVKYGLHDKALDHLQRIFSVDADNIEGHERAKTVFLATGRREDAARSLATLIRAYEAKGDPRIQAAREELRGIDPAHAALGDAAGAPVELGEMEAVEIGEVVEEHIDEGTIVDDSDVAFAASGAGDAEMEEIEEIEDEPLVPAPPPKRAAPAKPLTAPSESAPAAKAKPPAASAQPEDPFASDLAEAEFFIQSGMAAEARSLLEAILASAPGHAQAEQLLEGLRQPAPAPQDDLAAELAAELAEEIADVQDEGQQAIDTPESLDSFQVPADEVLGEFRARLQEAVRPEDVQTHYDLGIAYKEMGLLDEAISEFEVALRHGGGVRKTDSLTMLGVCALEKGDQEKAVACFKKGLAEPKVEPEAKRALAYELACAYEQLGQNALALEHFQTVERVEPGFRDVAERIARLGGTVSSPRRTPVPAAIPAAAKRPAAAAAALNRPAPDGGDGEPARAGDDAQQRRNRKIGFV